MYQPLILATWASDKVTTDDGSSGEDPGDTVLGLLPLQAARTKAAAEVRVVTARTRLPARRSPKGVRLFRVQRQFASLVLGLSAMPTVCLHTPIDIHHR